MGTMAIPRYRRTPGANKINRIDFLGYKALFVFIINSNKEMKDLLQKRNYLLLQQLQILLND
jgi:hypothetical protein